MALRIDINGLEDFMAFVAIIRNENPDFDKIKLLAAQLNTKSEELLKAEENQPKKGVSNA